MKKLRSFADIITLSEEVEHVLTLFSGGLDSTYLLELLKGQKVKVTALVVDLGEGVDREYLERITTHCGVDLIVEDARQAFIDHSVISAIQAHAMYLGEYPVSSSLSRPVIVKKAVETAKKLNCGAIIHTANQSQNSLRRLNGAIENSDYDGYYGSPYEYSAISREDKLSDLTLAGLFEFRNKQVSGDANLWCREFESGLLDNPESFVIAEDLYKWSVWKPALHFHESEHLIAIDYFEGVPVGLNGSGMPLVSIIENLNLNAGAYQIGRYIGFDHLEGGEKVLEVREAPAAALLMAAYRFLEMAILDTSTLLVKSQQSMLWTNEAVEGRWGSTLQRSTEAFIEHSAAQVTGTVWFTLSRGQSAMAKIVAQQPRYLADRDTWEVRVAHERSLRSLTGSESPSKQEVSEKNPSTPKILEIV